MRSLVWSALTSTVSKRDKLKVRLSPPFQVTVSQWVTGATIGSQVKGKLQLVTCSHRKPELDQSWAKRLGPDVTHAPNPSPFKQKLLNLWQNKKINQVKKIITTIHSKEKIHGFLPCLRLLIMLHYSQCTTFGFTINGSALSKEPIAECVLTNLHVWFFSPSREKQLTCYSMQTSNLFNNFKKSLFNSH